MIFDHRPVGCDFLVLSCFALVFVFVVLDDSDDAADNDGFLDETHCNSRFGVAEECWYAVCSGLAGLYLVVRM